MINYSSIFVAFIIVGFIATAFFVSGRKSKRAVGEVLSIFERHNAIGVQEAKMVDELGLASPTLVASLNSMRDYKPGALNTLIQMDIVRVTDEGKLYVSAHSLEELKRKGVIHG